MQIQEDCEKLNLKHIIVQSVERSVTAGRLIAC